MYYKTAMCIRFKVLINHKLQNFLHGLSILVLHIEVRTVGFAILYCSHNTITENFIMYNIK